MTWSLRLTVPDKIPSFLSQTSAAPRSTALVGDSGHIALFTTNSFLLDGEEYGKAVQRRPNRRSISARLSSTYVGRPWLHWPEWGVSSISRKRHSFLQMSGVCRL